MSPIAQSPCPGTHLAIRRHGLRRRVEPRRFDAQRGEVGVAPGGDEKPFGAQGLLLALDVDDEACAVMGDLPGPG
jgi:hypothetical protein